MRDLSQTRHVQPRDPLSSEVLAQPTQSLEYRLGLLEAELRRNAASQTTKVVITNVVLDTLVQANDTVYFNQATDKYERALAGAVYQNGTFTHIAASVAAGVVLRKYGSRGDVMTGGFDLWPEGNPALLLESGLTFKSGVPYFLSAQQAGKLTHNPPAYRVQVLLATDQHFIVAPSYSTIESFDDNFPLTVGMRPVGSLRSIAPNHQQTVVVGFDGLELNTATGRWESTANGTATHAALGWLVADARIDQTAAAFVVRVKVTTAGVITVVHATSLETLSAGTFYKTHTVASALSSGNYTVRREVDLFHESDLNNRIGSIYFHFTSYDLAQDREMVFRVPESFQGWKMVTNPKKPSISNVVVTSGVITRVDVGDPGIGLLTPPKVVLTEVGSGTGAIITPVLNENGSIVSFTVEDGGEDYSDDTVGALDSQLNTVRVLNGGSGATFSVTLSSGVVTAVTVTAGGANYWQPPQLEVVDATGAGYGARLLAVVENGALVRVQVLEGGLAYTSGQTAVRTWPSYYGYQPSFVSLRAAGGGETTAAVLTAATGNNMRFAGVRVDCGGRGYDSNLVIASSGGAGSGATFKAVIGTDGEVTRVVLVTPGTGFTSVPTFALSGAPDTAHGLRLTAIMEADITALTISNPGVGFARTPRIEVGVPVKQCVLDHGGTGYTSDSYAATISAPEFAGATQAVVTAYRGGRVTAVTVVPGSGYTTPQAAALTFDIGAVDETTAAEGSALVNLVPLFVGGELVSVQILRAGRGLTPRVGYTNIEVTADADADTIGLTSHGLVAGQRIVFAGTAVPGGVTAGVTYYVASTSLGADSFKVTDQADGSSSLALSSAGTDVLLTAIATYKGTITADNGSGASCEILVGDYDQLVEIVTTTRGTGHVLPPTVTLPAPSSGERAQAHAVLLGNGLWIQPTLHGLGGWWGTVPLQTHTWHQDLDDGAVAYNKPGTCGFYYNVKADPAFRAGWPARPLEKCSFFAGGVELRTAVVNQATGALAETADVGILSKTLAWRGLARLGAPWDATWQALVNDLEADGADAVFFDNAASDQGWRWWESLRKQEGNLATGQAHVNRTSRFYQSGRVQSLQVLSPLKLVDTLVGLDNSLRPGPMTGQLLLTLDTEENLLSTWSPQINTTIAGSRVALYHNTTGRPVFLKSVQLRTVFQVNASGAVPTAEHAALVTVGTAVGSYRDIVGVANPSLSSTPGVSIRLFADRQIKELLPDVDQASPVIYPNETVYLQVDAPAASAIVTQLVVARVMGHAL